MKYLSLRLALVSAALVFWYRLLQPGYLHPALLVYLFLGCLAGSLKVPFGPWLKTLLLGLGGLSSLIFLLVIPHSVYLVWFDLLSRGSPRGTVSWTILILAGFLSLLTCFDLGRKNLLKPLELFALVQALMLFLLFRDGPWSTLAILFFALYLLADFIPPGRPRGFPKALIRDAGICLLALILALLPIYDAEPAGKRLVDYHISRQLRYGLSRFVPDFPLLFGVSGHWLGQGFSTVELGGRASLSSKPVFSLQGRAGEYYYLRTRVFNHYSENSWQSWTGSDDESAWPTIGLFQQEPKPSSEPISPQSGQAQPDRLVSGEDRLRLTILDDFYNLLPHTLDTQAILLEKALAPGDISGGSATGFTLREVLLYGETLHLQRSAGPEPGQPGQGYLGPSRPDEGYLQVPASLGSGIRELSGTLSAATPRIFMDSLSKTLTQGFSYTLSPRNDLEGNGFLDNFLFKTREGYCVHFATAAVILARLKGIPARYASGYLVQIPEVEDEDILTASESIRQGIASGLNSHAWAELWFPDTGWLVYEATPVFRHLTARDPAGFTPELRTDAYSLRQLSAVSGQKLYPEKRESRRLWPYFLIPVLGSVLLLLGPQVLGKRKAWHVPAPGGSRLPPRFIRLGRAILAQTDHLGLPSPEEAGWLYWERQLQELLKRHSPAFSDYSLLRTVIFGLRQPGEPDYAQLKALYSQLKSLRRLKAPSGPLRSPTVDRSNIG